MIRSLEHSSSFVYLSTSVTSYVVHLSFILVLLPAFAANTVLFTVLIASRAFSSPVIVFLRQLQVRCNLIFYHSSFWNILCKWADNHRRPSMFRYFYRELFALFARALLTLSIFNDVAAAMRFLACCVAATSPLSLQRRIKSAFGCISFVRMLRIRFSVPCQSPLVV